MSSERADDGWEPWPENHEAMHVCPNGCSNNIMVLIDWELEDQARYDGDWLVHFRCGECHTFYEGVFTVDQLDSFDEVEAGHAKELERMEHELFEDAMGPFVTALESDLITADDFRGAHT